MPLGNREHAPFREWETRNWGRAFAILEHDGMAVAIIDEPDGVRYGRQLGPVKDLSDRDFSYEVAGHVARAIAPRERSDDHDRMRGEISVLISHNLLGLRQGQQEGVLVPLTGLAQIAEAAFSKGSPWLSVTVSKASELGLLD